MDAFLGKWLLDRSRDKGEEAYLNMEGIPADMAEKYKAGGVSLEISKQANNKYRYVHVCPGMPDTTNDFELGQETLFEMATGEKVKAKVSVDGDKIKESVCLHGVQMDSVKEIINGEMKSVTNSSNGELVQYFKRI
ncbi:fatty acid binding protein 1-B.1-like [Physella acuta]|uniref:fatty acid binding protein 1-B.1-like n=1 Tax=Physella acuta TaxID=109671 RepID=UPI0027DB456E|nr:fatty acid binding protein 1-B.1-like [Physella acuta]XP_059141893.1 fatty acid binding protein 1-B.1-like [Physella acuta]XP_059141894.1 fatty acid binding protein 1-B.1-like [Physella acuta]XP_059141895.1 fatty acid binding protein 1-B.1-like [Physella acuta]